MLSRHARTRWDARRLRRQSGYLVRKARAQATRCRQLCAELTGLHLSAPALRSLHLRGGSGGAIGVDVRRMIREKIRTRALPDGGCRSMLTSHGTGVECAGCDQMITEADRLVEADFIDG